MRCPLCGAEAVVVLSVERPDGCELVTRECRGELAGYHQGFRFRNLEVPESAFSRAGAKATAEMLDRAWRGVRRRAEAERRRATVRALAGHRPTAVIAKLLGVSATRVRQLESEKG